MPTGTRPAPPDDTVRLSLSGTVESMPFAMVQWLSVTAASRSAADLSAVLTTISGAYNTNIVPVVPNLVVLTQIQGVWKTPGSGEIVATNSTTRTGSLAGTMIGNVATCSVASWHIDQYYRGGKPRSYLPGVCTSQSGDGVHLTGAAITALASAWEAYRVAVNAASSGGISAVALGTVSFQRANEWRSPPVFYPFNSVSIRSTLGIQRRRLIP